MVKTLHQPKYRTQKKSTKKVFDKNTVFSKTMKDFHKHKENKACY